MMSRAHLRETVLACGAMVAAFVLSRLVSPDSGAILTPLVGAVLVAVWIGGVGVGSAAAALGVVLALWVAVDREPDADADALLRVAVYMVVAALAVGLGGAMRNARARAEAARRVSAAGEARLREERLTLEAVLRQMPDGVLIVDADGRVLLGNEPAVRALGTQEGTDARSLPLRTQDGHPLPAASQPLNRALTTGETLHGERLLAGPDTDPRVIEASATPVRAEDGSVLAAVLAVHDVTDRSRVERRLRLLADAGEHLAQPATDTERLTRLAAVTVPDLADLCRVDLRDADGTIHTVALVDSDPHRVRRQREPGARPPLDPDLPVGPPSVIRSGHSELYTEITDALLVAAARDEDELGDLRAVGMQAVMVVPICSANRVFGAITLVSTSVGRTFGASELTLAEELGRRAGLAMELTGLLEAETSARQVAEAATDRLARLYRVTAAFSRALTMDDVLDAVARETEAATDFACVVLTVGDDGRLANRGAGPSVHAVANRAVTQRRLVVETLTAGRSPAGPSFPLGVTGLDMVVAVPLTQGLRVLGALCLGAVGDPPGREDRGFLTSLADLCAGAIDRARRYDLEREVASTLQTRLLPAALPVVPGYTLAARYVAAGPGTEAGGDWYEAVPLPDARVALAVGDVVGRGAEAAAVMGQLRSVMHALALEDARPREVARRMDRFAGELPGASFSTMAYMLLTPADGTVRYTSAGHVPPIVHTPSAGARYLDDAGMPPLAAVPVDEIGEAVTVLPEAGYLVLYTDGLVERRDRPLQDRLDRLRAAVDEGAGLDPDEMCTWLMRAMDVGDGHDDDVAVLVIRRDPPA